MTISINFIQNGNTALLEASENGHTAVVKALVDNGAGIEKQNKVCALRVCETSLYFTSYNGIMHIHAKSGGAYCSLQSKLPWAERSSGDFGECQSKCGWSQQGKTCITG